MKLETAHRLSALDAQRVLAVNLRGGSEVIELPQEERKNTAVEIFEVAKGLAGIRAGICGAC